MLDCGSNGLGSSPGRGKRVLFLGRTLHCPATVPLLHSGVFQMVTSKCNVGGNPAMDYRPIQGGSRKTPSRFMLQETEISSGLTSSLARMQTLTSFTVQARILLAIYADALWALHHPSLGIV